MFTIYMIVGPTGKYYIGQTRLSLDIRWRTHRTQAQGRGRNKCRHLANAICKYGSEGFDIQPLLFCTTKEQANEQERIIIAATNAQDPRVGYNLTAGGDGSLGIRGHRLSEEHKKKLSLAKIGNKINLGRKHSAERRAIESAAHLGYVHTPEQKAKNRASHLGRTYKKRKPMSQGERKIRSLAQHKRQEQKFLKAVAWG